MGITDETELTGEAGKFNIYQGLKNSIWKTDAAKTKQ